MRYIEAYVHTKASNINIQSTIIHNSRKIHNNQKEETIQMSINWQAEKQNLVYTKKYYPAIKEWGSDTCDNTDTFWKHYAKLKKSERKRYIV